MQRDRLEQMTERARERLEERVEHEQLSRERAGPLLGLKSRPKRKGQLADARQVHQEAGLTLKVRGTMLSTRMMRSIDAFSDSEMVERWVVS